LNIFLNLKLKYGYFILGFDLVGNEHKTESKHYSQMLYDFKQEALKKHPEIKFDYFLHAGESISTLSDNLLECILLQVPRIGHGTNLINKLYLLEDIRKNEILIECNPSSNQILGYIDDLNIHPMKAFLDSGVKISINSDDDGVYGTSSLLNFDFFICAYCLNFDFFDLKQCILNSVNYSKLNNDKLETIKSNVLQEWDKFILNFLKNSN
jgi:adenosine deaminase CECR1